jgi:hypothetical protein
VICRDAFALADDVQADEFVVVGFNISGRFAQYLSVVAPERAGGQVFISACTPHLVRCVQW